MSPKGLTLARLNIPETSHIAGLISLAGLVIGTVVYVEVDCQTSHGKPF